MRTVTRTRESARVCFALSVCAVAWLVWLLGGPGLHRLCRRRTARQCVLASLQLGTVVIAVIAIGLPLDVAGDDVITEALAVAAVAVGLSLSLPVAAGCFGAVYEHAREYELGRASDSLVRAEARLARAKSELLVHRPLPLGATLRELRTARIASASVALEEARERNSWARTDDKLLARPRWAARGLGALLALATMAGFVALIRLTREARTADEALTVGVAGLSWMVAVPSVTASLRRLACGERWTFAGRVRRAHIRAEEPPVDFVALLLSNPVLVFVALVGASTLPTYFVDSAASKLQLYGVSAALAAGLLGYASVLTWPPLRSANQPVLNPLVRAWSRYGSGFRLLWIGLFWCGVIIVLVGLGVSLVQDTEPPSFAGAGAYLVLPQLLRWGMGVRTGGRPPYTSEELYLLLTRRIVRGRLNVLVVLALAVSGVLGAAGIVLADRDDTALERKVDDLRRHERAQDPAQTRPMK